jgi:SAM-dependent methyltransferase
MDAEQMSFPDGSFDFIWSWGVIHHSADTRRVVQEMNRVLRANGTSTVMVYRRSWWHYYVVYGLLKGVIQGKMRRNCAVLLAARVAGGDGRSVQDQSIQIYGLKADVIPLPHGRLKSLTESVVPDAVARFLTNRMRMGLFLVAHMRKK